MDRVNPPLIVKRRARALLLAMLRRIPAQLGDWKPELPTEDEAALALADDPRDFGMALLKLAAHLGEQVAGQINRVPSKNFLAFLDMLGMDRRPPQAARVPLSFSLSRKAPTDRLVPQGTQVGAAKRDDVVFETETDLLVTRATLTDAYSVDWLQDRFIDLGRLISQPASVALEVFGQSATPSAWLPHTHALLLGHDTLYSMADQAGSDLGVTLHWTGDSSPALQWAYSTADGWRVAAAAASGTTSGTTSGAASGMTSGAASADPVYWLKTPGIAAMTLTGRDERGVPISRTSCWVRAQSGGSSPNGLAGVELGVHIVDRPAALGGASFNASPLDLGKDFFPFGERPRFNDTLYLASRQAFSVAGAQITLCLALTAAPTGTPPAPVRAVGLVWEYWHGDRWEPIASTTETGATAAGTFEFSDGTQAFTRSGNVSFRCPPMAPTTTPTTQQGVQDWWIRVRIVSGGYGQEAGYRQGSNQGLKDQLQAITTDPAQYQSVLDLLARNGLVDSFIVVPASFAPPSIASLTLRYSAASLSAASTLLTDNNFVVRVIPTAGPSQPFRPFRPFVAWSDPRPAVYLAFDPGTTEAGTPICLYIQVVQAVFGARDPAQAVGSSDPAAVVWWYWQDGGGVNTGGPGTGWQRLPAEDETANLSGSGLLRFIWPADAGTHCLFGRERLWLRASLESGGYAAAPQLAAFTLNTVWARHGVSFHDHVLGSSNGDPGQQFQFAKTPVLAGQLIEVREPTLPSDADRLRIEAEEGPQAIRAVRDAAGNLLEVWVRWHAVKSLNLSTSADRHYRADSITGAVVFGDGTQGRAPPAGRENVVARSFRSGGGAKGLCAAGTLTELKTTIAFIDQVSNHEASFGGTDADTVDDVLTDAPQRIKSRDHAVTAEDFEWLAREASTEVAKTRCLPLTRADSLVAADRQGADPGWVTVIVVPQGTQDQPLPTEQLIGAVRRYLTDRSSLTLGGRIDVIGPRYVPIDIAALVVPRRIEQAKAVEKRVFDRLSRFLHPLGAGPDGSGWQFGRAVHLSEIAAVVQGTEGVDSVRSLSLRRAGSDQALQRVDLSSHDLPASGRHSIVAAGG